MLTGVDGLDRFVKPSYDNFVLPSSKFADIVRLPPMRHSLRSLLTEFRLALGSDRPRTSKQRRGRANRHPHPTSTRRTVHLVPLQPPESARSRLVFREPFAAKRCSVGPDDGLAGIVDDFEGQGDAEGGLRSLLRSAGDDVRSFPPFLRPFATQRLTYWIWDACGRIGSSRRRWVSCRTRTRRSERRSSSMPRARRWTSQK